MPPAGTPDTQAPQGPPPPISVGSEASQHAAQLYEAANQRPLDQNVPAASDQLAPPEETIPADVMPGAVKIPVATPQTPMPVDAATAFAPKAPETPTAPPAPATVEPIPTSPQDWSDAQMESAITQNRADALAPLTPAALDADAQKPEIKQQIEGLSNVERALADNPTATLAAAAEMARSGDKAGLRTLAPALRQAIDRITSN